MALVVIDLDGTLIEGPVSSEKMFFRYLLERRLLGASQLAAFGYFFLSRFPEYGRLTPKKNKAYLSGFREAPLAEAAREFVKLRIMGRCCPEMLRRIEDHLAQGDVTLLVTGTLEMIARPVCSALGIRHLIATRCVLKNGVFSSMPPLVHPFGPEKVQLTRAICRELDCELAGAVAYGNDKFDIPLLEAVGHPVAVHPDGVLYRHALARSWEILDHPK